MAFDLAKRNPMTPLYLFLSDFVSILYATWFLKGHMLYYTQIELAK